MTLNWNAIEAECPGISVRSPRFIGEGWCSRSYLVNDQLVFRFPKSRGQWDELNRDIEFLKSAGDKLPLKIGTIADGGRALEGQVDEAWRRLRNSLRQLLADRDDLEDFHNGTSPLFMCDIEWSFSIAIT